MTKFEKFKLLLENNEFLVATLETIYMTVVSMIFAYLFGLIIGVLLYITKDKGLKQNKILNKVLGFIVNVARSIPFIILITALIPVTKLLIGKSIGNEAMIIILIIGATPYIARLVESSLNEVNYGVIEASIAMGSSTWQIIRKVLLPEAKPGLINGFIIATVTVIGYTAMASTIAGGGLGALASQYGKNQYNNYVIWFCILIIVIIVQAIQEVGIKIVKKIDKRRG